MIFTSSAAVLVHCKATMKRCLASLCRLGYDGPIGPTRLSLFSTQLFWTCSLSGLKHATLGRCLGRLVVRHPMLTPRLKGKATLACLQLTVKVSCSTACQCNSQAGPVAISQSEAESEQIVWAYWHRTGPTSWNATRQPRQIAALCHCRV